MSIAVRLGIMMFLQYAIWGAWSPVLSEYLINDLGFSGGQAGVIYSLLPLATIIAPFIGGQLVDRWFSTERVIAFLQLTGGVLLIAVSRTTSYTAMLWLMLLYCLLYAPTLALTNSIAFINLTDSESQFGRIRVWGSIGWIAAGLGISLWRTLAETGTGLAMQGDMLMLGGIVSLVMGIQSLSLPHTPPKKESESPWAFMEALKMLKDKNFLVFLIISFVVGTELMFYYILTAPFLTSDIIGVSPARVAAVMAIAQVAEMGVMYFALPRFLPRFGLRNTLVVGVLAWPLRYIVFAIGAPAWLVIASLALHGVCYVFFFVAAYIYVDTVAPKDIRASAQSLITLVTLGLGNYVGSLFAGWIHTVFTVNEVTNWRGVFLVPFGITILCAAAFLLFFRDTKAAEAA